MDKFIKAFEFRFAAALVNINRYRKSDPVQVVKEIERDSDKLIIRFISQGQEQCLAIPVPYTDSYGNYVVGDRVIRAVGTWYHSGKEHSYWALLSWLLLENINSIFPNVSRKPQLEKLINGFIYHNAPLVFRTAQDMIDNIVNRLPLTGTPMETWAMCQRVVFLDPEFNQLTPQEALTYQKELNKKHFPWTSVGLSDSGMCNNNLLKVDLRKFTPFGIRHHNPMRNLYQTLGMKGDEGPVVQTKSMFELTRDRGVARRGWNFMTCFLDTPLNFEDQLIVDNRHLDKFTFEKRRFVCFGKVAVCAGDEIEEGSIISVEPNGKNLCFWVKSDRAIVTKVDQDVVIFNGGKKTVSLVYVETKHRFKEGVKLTNCHGNKGVVTFADCGMMFDEGRQKETPIDIIVSARTIGKRKNFGQVLEILLTLIKGTDKDIIIPDDSQVSLEKLSKALANHGYKSDGTSPVTTEWFTGRALCGWGFWGLIKNPENQLWTKADVLVTDGRDRRQSGVKLSHIELKGLTTIFGAKNPVTDEILSHQQGFDDVYEMMQILETLRGTTMRKPVLDWSCLKPLHQSRGYFHSKEEVGGTIADETTIPDGFMLGLPLVYHVFVPDDERVEAESRVLPLETIDFEAEAKPDGTNIFLDKIYVPKASLRCCWQHSTGLLGLSDVGGHLNNIVHACHQLKNGSGTEQTLLRAIDRYFKHVSSRMSTKTGEIATYALAVRYPHSVKATATLAKEGLPNDWVEIHSDMAEDLGVETGDYIIAERFPCLGFKSLRIQRVRVTNDPQCRYVVRVSGNSLVSQNLDFDGDVLFLMSFKTKEAVQLLEQEFNNPDELREKYIQESNSVKKPTTATADLSSIRFETFPDLTPEKQAEIVGGLTGLKRGTGTIVALAYNLMRIIEGNVGYDDRETNLAMEVILDKVANSVFGQKHAGTSLEERCKRAICTADLKDMLEMGFPLAGSKRLCQIIVKEAGDVGVKDLQKHYRSHMERGKSNIINLIVRKKHKFYFATRSNLHPVRLLEYLNTPPTDLTSHMWHRALKLKAKEDDLSSMQVD